MLLNFIILSYSTVSFNSVQSFFSPLRTRACPSRHLYGSCWETGYMRFEKTLLEFHSLNSHYPSDISFTKKEQSLAGPSKTFSAVCSPLSLVHFHTPSGQKCLDETPCGVSPQSYPQATQDDVPWSNARHDLKAQNPAELLSGCKNGTWEMKKKTLYYHQENASTPGCSILL